MAETKETYASSHFVIFVIWIDSKIIQCVPLDEIAYCFNQRNDDTISIKCYHSNVSQQQYEGVHLLSVAAAEIQNSKVLWQEDRAAIIVKSRDGILKQLGRMIVQDKLVYTDCVYLASLAIAAIQAGFTTREVEVALRKIRMAAKSSMKNPDSEALYCALGDTVDIL